MKEKSLISGWAITKDCLIFGQDLRLKAKQPSSIKSVKGHKWITHGSLMAEGGQTLAEKKNRKSGHLLLIFIKFHCLNKQTGNGNENQILPHLLYMDGPQIKKYSTADLKSRLTGKSRNNNHEYYNFFIF